MNTITLEDARDRFSELVLLVAQGETVVVTLDGKPVFDLIPHRPKGGLNWSAIDEYKRKHGIDRIFPHIPEDFDDPLPEDFLLRPLPE